MELFIDINKFSTQPKYEDLGRIDETINYLIARRTPFITAKDTIMFHEDIYLEYKSIIDYYVDNFSTEILNTIVKSI